MTETLNNATIQVEKLVYLNVPLLARLANGLSSFSPHANSA